MTSISFVPNINTLLDQQVGQRVTHISLITRDTQRPVTNVSYGTEEFHKRVLFFKFCIIYALYVCVCVCVCGGGGGRKCVISPFWVAFYNIAQKQFIKSMTPLLTLSGIFGQYKTRRIRNQRLMRCSQYT